MRGLRGLLVLAGILAVLLFTYFFVLTQDQKRTAQIEVSDTPVSLSLIDVRLQPETVELSSPKKTLTIDTQSLADTQLGYISIERSYLMLLIQTVGTLPIRSTIREVSHRDDYGLLSSETRTVLQYADGRRLALFLGGRTFDHSSYYMSIEGNETIYTIAPQTAAILFPDPDLIRQNPIPVLDGRRFEGLSVTSPTGSSFTIAKRSEQDQFTSRFTAFLLDGQFGITLGVNEQVLSELLLPFTTELIPTGYIDDPGNLSVYGLDEQQAQQLAIGPGQLELLIGDAIGENRYVRLTGEERYIFTLPSESLRIASIDPFELVYPYPLLVDIDRIEECILSYGDSLVRLSHMEDSYLLDGVEITEQRFRELFSLVSGTAAIGTTAEAATAPADLLGSVTFRSHSGEQRVYRWYESSRDRAEFSVDGNLTTLLFDLQELILIIETFTRL